jgi:hypothetical protein
VHRSDLLQHAASECANMYHQTVVDEDESHTESMEEASEGVIYSWELRCRV